MEEPGQFGIVGLGRIGNGLAVQGVSQGLHVVGYDPAGVPPGLLQGGIDLIDKPQQFRQRLEKPRLVFLAVPAGEAVNPILAQLTPVLDADDVRLFESFREKLPVEAILYNWSHSSVIRSGLLELLAEEYHEHAELRDLPDHVEDTGEVSRLVEDAMRMEVPIPVITQSVMQLFASRDKSAA